jgi:hypothetical protein
MFGQSQSFGGTERAEFATAALELRRHLPSEFVAPHKASGRALDSQLIKITTRLLHLETHRLADSEGKCRLLPP